MRKFKKILRITVIFSPAVLFILLFVTQPGMAVSFLNPAKAIAIQVGLDSSDTSYTGPNPFRDFSFEELNQSKYQNNNDNYTVQPINPNYNVTQLFFTSEESDIVLKKDECYVKNMTHLSAEQVKDIMLSPVGFSPEKNSRQPQILIMHTHATESYLPRYNTPYDSSYSFRNTDTSLNMVAVGKIMADTLNNLGYNTIQDSTLHDYPSYNGSYDNSKTTVEYYLEKYPSIKIVLDVHRDAVERDGRIISPVSVINGVEYAQIMIISGADNGYMNMPNYKENLKFATLVQNQTAKKYPGLMRPVLFDYRNYNQQLTTGSILVEIGTHGSTIEQAKNSAYAFAVSLAEALDEIT